jgi:hypothetical protein
LPQDLASNGWICFWNDSEILIRSASSANTDIPTEDRQRDNTTTTQRMSRADIEHDTSDVMTPKTKSREADMFFRRAKTLPAFFLSKL